jgi:hypothetical protein
MSGLADILKDSAFLGSIKPFTIGTKDLKRPYTDDSIGKFDQYDGVVTFNFKFEYPEENQAFLKEHTTNEKIGDWTKLKVIEFGGFKHENVQMRYDLISEFFDSVNHRKDYCKAISLVLYVEDWLFKRYSKDM